MPEQWAGLASAIRRAAQPEGPSAGRPFTSQRRVQNQQVAPACETVLRNSWGVAHIYAQNQHDLFFAQGFVAAQDRLFQMELWKRSGQGRLAENSGPSALQRDANARLLSYLGA